MNLLFAGLSLLKAAPAGGESSPGSSIITFGMLGLMFVVFYFFMIRPQKKKEKEAKTLRESVKKGDQVVTIGGVHGVVAKVYEQTILLQIHDAKIEFSKAAISTVVPKGTKIEVPRNSSEDAEENDSANEAK